MKEVDDTYFMPEWIRDPKVKEMVESEWKYMIWFLEIKDPWDTIFVPPYPNRGPNFDERLYLATDGKIEDMIAEDNQKFIDKVNSGKQLEKWDFESKDNDLIKKMNIIA